MGRILASLCLATFGLVLAGCAPALDPDQARLCRIALVGISPPASDLIIVRQSLLPSDAGGAGVRIDALSTTPDHRERPIFAECRFAPSPIATARPDLVTVRSDQGPLSPPSLFFLKRFWLDSAEAQSADPQPLAGWSRAPRVPADVAHALQDLLNALPAMATYAMLSAAYSLVYGLVNRINLAFGSMAAIGGVAGLTGTAFLTSPGSLALMAAALAAALWATTIHGVVIARVVFQPLGRATGQQGLVATIGLALVLNEYLRIAQGPTPLWITPLRTAPFVVARSGGFPVTITPIALELTGLFMTVAAGVLLLMARSQFGRNWRALSDDPMAAALLGVSANRVFMQTFALASALAGAAGAMVVVVYGSFGESFGAVIGLKGLLAAVLGGIGSVRGALLGGVAISGLEALWSANFPIEYRDLVLFTLLACTLIVWPGGFLGYRNLGPRQV